MPLTLHHLGKSQSERVLFLLEELELPYELVVHDRNPDSGLAPDSLKQKSPTGTAPCLVDDPPNVNSAQNDDQPIVISESGACVEYIVSTYKPDSKIIKRTEEPGYADFLTWVHYSNATLQASMNRMNLLKRADVDPESGPYKWALAKLPLSFGLMEKQLEKTGAYLAGDRLTTADIMCFFSLTTMRGFVPYDLSEYPKILEYLQRVAERPAYKRAMEKGDKGLEPMVGGTVEKFKYGVVK